MNRILLAFLLVLATPAFAASWYVDNAAAGTNSGTSWTNAWTSFASISWASVNAGDTVFISGGSTTKNYTGNLTVSGDGASDASRITIRVGQDANHNGTITMSGDITISNADYVTIDGEYNGATHWQLNNGWIISQLNLSPVVRYIDLLGGSIAAQYGFHGLFSHITRTPTTDEDYVIGLAARNDKDGPNEVQAYDDIIVEYSHLVVCAAVTENGTGSDGIQGAPGLTIRYSTIESTTVGCTIGSEHQDLVQTQANWFSAYGNVFKDGADANIGFDCFNSGTPNHFRIFNNVFIKSRGGASVRFYGAVGSPCNSFDNIHINNNTFVDHTCCADNVVNATGFNANPSVTNSDIKNNIFYNNTYQDAINITASTNWVATDWNVDYNVVNTSGGINLDGSAYTQAHPFTCAPTFLDYIEDSLSADLRLSSSDTCAKDAGISLSSQFTTDKDSVARPQGSAWDIGAYEATVTAPSAPPNFRLVRYNPVQLIQEYYHGIP